MSSKSNDTKVSSQQVKTVSVRYPNWLILQMLIWKLRTCEGYRF